MADLLVLGGALLASADAPLRHDTGVLLVDGCVAAIAGNDSLLAEHPRADTVDARDLLLMPGLVNAHMHSYGLLAHGLMPETAPAGFFEFLEDFWWPKVEDRLDRAMIEAAMELAMCQMIRSGVTMLCDVLEAPNATPGILEAEADVVRRAGLRAVLMTEASERIDRTHGQRLLEENARFIEAHRHDEALRGMLCLHTSFTCSEGFVRRAVAMRDDLRCGLHLHLSESPYEPARCEERSGLRPVAWYDRIGLWNRKTLASQAVAVDDAEIRLLALRGVKTVHMPLSNCEVGGGISPVPTMIAQGMEPGLGTDGYINNLFEVMRGAFLIHKGALRDPSVMSSREVFRMATEWGARALGFEDCGAMVCGAKADLVGIDLQFDTPLTEANVVDQIVLHRDPPHVRLSIVGGRKLMERGKLVSLDEERARREAAVQARRLWEGI